MAKLKIGSKLLIVLLAVSLVPLAAINFYWFHSTQASLRADAASRLDLLKRQAVSNVDYFITDKLNLLIEHSQSAAIQNFEIANATSDLEALIKQDNDLEQVALVDASGNQRVVVNHAGQLVTPVNIASSNDFKVATFLAGKEYISPVRFNAASQPIITISVPLVSFNDAQNLTNLSTDESGQIRGGHAIKGVLTATVDLGSLWQNVLAQKTGTKSYAYVVDSQGALLAYPKQQFLASHHELKSVAAVASFLKNPGANAAPMVTTSELGQPVLSSYSQIPETGWGVIAEEPTASIYASANRIVDVGIALFIVVAVLVIIMSYLFSRRLTKPIKRLAAGSEKIASGDLQARVPVTSRDEIGAASVAFNSMATSMANSLHQAVAESAKLKIILDNVGEGVIAIDASGRIVLANLAAAVLVGGMPKDIIGRKFQDCFALEQNEEPFVPPTGKSDMYKDITLTSPQRRVHYMDILVNRMTDDPSGITAIFTIIDRTGERDLEMMKVDFVSMAAHELRTPITAIRGYLELIKLGDESALAPPVRGYVQNIRASAVQLVGLINNLLNVSRIERGALSLNFDKVDWSAAVARAVQDQKFAAESKHIELVCELPEKPVFILADPVAIVEIINNLLTNAIHYTQDGGHIQVRVKQTADGVVTEVQDDGVGISANNLPHLFTKFYRAHGGLASGSGGSGLGLFISKSIADMSGGSLTCSSVENAGSTFTLKLPDFDEAKYSAIMKSRPEKLTKTHGWTTKNIAR